MAEMDKQASQTSDIPSSPTPLLQPFLEVMCKTSGITRRFAPGTKAGFALSLINNKLDAGAPLGVYIEAVKDGEESINFGPSSVLLSYGTAWKLQTVLDGQPGVKKREGTQTLNKPLSKKQVSEQSINLLYVGKILLVFLFIFLLGSAFIIVLENLPRLLSLMNSSL
ncbi:uncharacterized protein LOC141594958 [Silene latifolia]|uniref:uncharacterized protein LOC141594958 n=1 Tax=Silene latifolia TaxID=37657 RepID=UPI003D76B3A0